MERRLLVWTLGAVKCVTFFSHRGYLRELLLLQVLCDGRVKVHGVAFVQAVNLASFLDLHVTVDQDEFTKSLKQTNQKKKKVNAELLLNIWMETIHVEKNRN